MNPISPSRHRTPSPEAFSTPQGSPERKEKVPPPTPWGKAGGLHAVIQPPPGRLMSRGSVFLAYGLGDQVTKVPRKPLSSAEALRIEQAFDKAKEFFAKEAIPCHFQVAPSRFVRDDQDGGFQIRQKRYQDLYELKEKNPGLVSEGGEFHRIVTGLLHTLAFDDKRFTAPLTFPLDLTPRNVGYDAKEKTFYLFDVGGEFPMGPHELTLHVRQREKDWQEFFGDLSSSSDHAVGPSKRQRV